MSSNVNLETDAIGMYQCPGCNSSNLKLVVQFDRVDVLTYTAMQEYCVFERSVHEKNDVLSRKLVCSVCNWTSDVQTTLILVSANDDGNLVVLPAIKELVTSEQCEPTTNTE